MDNKNKLSMAIKEHNEALQTSREAAKNLLKAVMEWVIFLFIHFRYSL